MKSFGFKQLRRKEGPSFYLKGFQRSKCQWGRTKVRNETSSQGSLSLIRGTLQTTPYSDGAISLQEFGGSIYDSGEEEDDMYDKELAEDDIDELEDQEDGS
jgi:hypothetical protein